MDPALWAVLLLLAAIALLFAEVFIPSHGMIFVSAMICLGIAIYFAYQAWWDRHPIWWWTYIVSVMILIPLSIAGAIQLWPYTPIGRSMEPPTLASVTPNVAERERLGQLVGRDGETVTQLSPAGMVRVAGERWHATSEGLILEAGRRVRVLAVQGSRLVVREVADSDPSLAAAPRTNVLPLPSTAGSAPPADRPPLDFELPPG